MSRLYLLTKDKKYPKGEWELVLGKNRVRLTDPEGYVEAEFDLETAPKRFHFPSFWNSIKLLGIVNDQQKVIFFEKDKDAIAEIHQYLDYSLAAQGEEVIARTRRKAWWMIFGGIPLLLAGIVILVLLIVFNVLEGGELRLKLSGPVVLMVLGGSLLGTGMAYLGRARRAEREWDAGGEK